MVIADDLTGAAEIAAIGHLRGLSTAIVLDTARGLPLAEELVVIDSNTRLETPERAAARVSALASLIPETLRGRVFKKVDSVLRGQVAAELETLCEKLGRQASLLCPCNPSRGRCITEGRYTIDGVPLHQTAFASDPHQPATSDRVEQLLGRTGQSVQVHDAQEAPLTALGRGLNVGSAANAREIRTWAARLHEGILPAGGADFFEAYLSLLGLPAPLAPEGCVTPGPHLLLSGSLAPAGRSFRNALADTGTPLVRLPVQAYDPAALDTALEQLAKHLAATGIAIAATNESPLEGADSMAWLQTCFSTTATRLRTRRAFRHLLAEGGSTAALAAACLGWNSLTVAGVWAGGVVSLRPDHDPSMLFTMKPGSYSWPDRLRELLGTTAT